MDATEFSQIAASCAPAVAIQTARALVAVESGFNPWAIGVVGAVLERQPRHRDEAVATAQALVSQGRDFSVGLAQINQRHFAHLGLSLRSAFEPCANLGAMQVLLADCWSRAGHRSQGSQDGLRRALSCYYSGDFATGLRDGYVARVVRAAIESPKAPARP